MNCCNLEVMVLKRILFCLVFICIYVDNAKTWSVGDPLGIYYPCRGLKYVVAAVEKRKPPDPKNQYDVSIQKALPANTRILVKFNRDAKVTVFANSFAKLTSNDDRSFLIKYSKESPKNGIGFHVKGPKDNVTVPYITSLSINSKEYCRDTDDEIVIDDNTCGRRIIKHTELITNGSPTKAGDWPWHAAIYRYERNALLYKCGGTLISRSAVLTAAHCTTIRGQTVVPEILSVVLGKYNLYGGDIGSQEREVFKVIVHKEYNATFLDNDISILKLTTEVAYTAYVQPACLWDLSIPSREYSYGTVAGWGFDHTDKLSTQLRQATIPKVSEIICLKSNPVFFGKLLNDNKFCGGYRNGTSACNGDSGGGFVVFVPNNNDDYSKGLWYVQGVVSVGVSRSDANICDPTEFTLFTDVTKYIGWIKKNVNSF